MKKENNSFYKNIDSYCVILNLLNAGFWRFLAGGRKIEKNRSAVNV